MKDSSSFKVFVSERAAQLLVSHTTFLSQVNVEAAENLVAAFETAADSLAFMPQRCP